MEAVILVAAWGQGDRKGHLGVMNMFIILIVMIASLVCFWVKTYHIVCFK
jgi:hypothetical protein